MVTHLQNRSDQPALILEVGSRRPDEDVAQYPDIDLRYSTAAGDMHKNGTPYLPFYRHRNVSYRVVSGPSPHFSLVQKATLPDRRRETLSYALRDRTET